MKNTCATDCKLCLHWSYGSSITVFHVSNTHTIVSRPFLRDYPGELVPGETFTHSNISWSSTVLYQLPPSTTIHSILSVQFTCLTVFLHNLSPGSLWSTSWSAPSTLYSIHFFTQLLPSFHNICPYHRNLFCCNTEIMSPNPSLSLNSLLGTLSLTLISYLTIHFSKISWIPAQKH